MTVVSIKLESCVSKFTINHDRHPILKAGTLAVICPEICVKLEDSELYLEKEVRHVECILLKTLLEMGFNPSTVWPIKITTPLTPPRGPEVDINPVGLVVEGQLLGVISRIFANVKLEIRLSCKRRSKRKDQWQWMNASINVPLSKPSPQQEEKPVKRRKLEKGVKPGSSQSNSEQDKFLVFDTEWCDVVRECDASQGVWINVSFKCDVDEISDLSGGGKLKNSQFFTNGKAESLKKKFRLDQAILKVANGSSLVFHKCLLKACSPVFADICKQNARKKCVIIELPDLNAVDVTALLRCIFFGELSSTVRKSSGEAIKLLKAALQYSIKPLETAVKGALLDKPGSEFEPGDAIDLLLFARRTEGCEELTRKAVMVLKLFGWELGGNPVFQKLFKDDSQRAMDLCLAIASFKG